MFQLTILAGLLSVALASPQWYPQPAYHGAHAGYGHGAAAPLGPDGRVVDTPEVAASKAAHLAALAEASARAPHGPADHHDGAYHDGAYHDGWNAPNPAYAPAHLGPRGPPAPLGPDGRVVDTPEVQAAKAHHFALYNAAAQSAPAGPAHAAPAYPAHADYDSGAYNPAWDSPAWNHY